MLPSKKWILYHSFMKIKEGAVKNNQRTRKNSKKCVCAWCRHQQAVSMVLWLRWDKFTWTTESSGGKGTTRPLSQGESAPTLTWTGFYCFSGHITLRMVPIYYAQIRCRWLPFTDNKGQNAVNYFKEKDVTDQGGKWLNWLHSILWRFSSDFRKLKILLSLIHISEPTRRCD